MIAGQAKEKSRLAQLPVVACRWFYLVLIYTAGLFLLLPLRFVRRPGIVPKLPQLLGFVNPAPESVGGICLHTVSVGEAVAAKPLVDAILQNTGINLPLLITATTLTGAEQVQSLYGEEAGFCFFPLDSPGAVKRFLKRTRPRLMLLMETEIWPNLIHYCRRKHIPVIILNARLSERSAARYRRLQPFTGHILGQLSAVVAQSQADGDRFIALGLPAERLTVTRNFKFHLQLTPQLHRMAAEYRSQWGERPVWVAGSTHKGEEKLVLQAARQLWNRFPDMLLVLVPRHPERFVGVAELCRDLGEEPVLYSTGQSPESSSRVLLVDAMGQLRSLLGAADVALIGGSLVNLGGHNVLEASVWGVPVIVGPHYRNFHQIVTELEQVGALQILTEVSAENLAARVIPLLEDEHHRNEAGMAGKAMIENSRGSLEEVCRLIETIVAEDSAKQAI